MAKEKKVVDPNEIPLTEDEKNYGDAFDQFASAEPKDNVEKEEEVIENDDVNAGTAGTAGSAGEEEVVEDDKNQGTDGTAAVQAPPADAGWEQEKAELLGRIAKVEAENKKIREAAPPPEPAASKKKPKVEPDEDDDEDPLANLTEELKNELKEYETDFAEISKFEKVKRDAEYKKLEKRFSKRLDEALEKINSIVGQMSEFATEYSREKHRTFIISKHADFDELVESGKVEAWIKTQPAEIREVYQKWYDEGSTKQVVSLFDIYKEKTKPPAKKEEPPPTPPVKEKKEEKKRDLEAIPSRSTPVGQALDQKKSYEDAFDEFAAGVGKK